MLVLPCELGDETMALVLMIVIGVSRSSIGCLASPRVGTRKDRRHSGLLCLSAGHPCSPPPSCSGVFFADALNFRMCCRQQTWFLTPTPPYLAPPQAEPPAGIRIIEEDLRCSSGMGDIKSSKTLAYRLPHIGLIVSHGNEAFVRGVFPLHVLDG